MKKVVYTIFGYCCLMAAAMAYMLVLDVLEVRQLMLQTAFTQANLASIQEHAEVIQREFDDMAREQRQHRPELNGEQAVTVSQAVQVLNDELTQVRQQEEQARAAVFSNEDTLEQQQLLFIPHIAFLFLHILSIWLFWPWRVFAISSKKPTREWTPK